MDFGRYCRIVELAILLYYFISLEYRNFQSHENMEIYQKAFDIIERYFGTEEEDKDVSKYLEKKYALNKCL